MIQGRLISSKLVWLGEASVRDCRDPPKTVKVGSEREALDRVKRAPSGSPGESCLSCKLGREDIRGPLPEMVARLTAKSLRAGA